MGDNLPIYHIERTVIETDKRFGDEAHIIYVNGATEDDGSIGQLMYDFRCTDPKEILKKATEEDADRISV